MKKYFVDVPIRKLVKKGRRILYALGDLAECYVHFKFEQDGLLFKAYYRQSGYWQAYYIKHSKKVRVHVTDNHVTILNNVDFQKPSHVKILYQDKVCRLLMFTTKGKKKDFVFVLKSQESENTDE